MLQVKVPIIFFGTPVFSARRDGRYTYIFYFFAHVDIFGSSVTITIWLCLLLNQSSAPVLIIHTISHPFISQAPNLTFCWRYCFQTMRFFCQSRQYLQYNTLNSNRQKAKKIRKGRAKTGPTFLNFSKLGNDRKWDRVTSTHQTRQCFLISFCHGSRRARRSVGGWTTCTLLSDGSM
jgi:hypothetical protein